MPTPQPSNSERWLIGTLFPLKCHLHTVCSNWPLILHPRPAKAWLGLLCCENPTKLQTPLSSLQATVSGLYCGVGASVGTLRTRRHRANFKVCKFQEWFPLLGVGWGGQGRKPDFFECISCGREDEGPKDAHVLIPRIREYLTLRPKGLWRCDELRTQRQEIVLDSWRWGHVLTTSL